MLLQSGREEHERLYITLLLPFQRILSVSVRLVIRAIQVYTQCVFKAQLKELTVNNNPSNQFALRCKVLLPRAAEEPLVCFVPARRGKRWMKWRK